MAVPAEAAIRAWVNSQPDLVGEGNPLSGGAYLREQRSPDAGAYAVVARTPGGGDLVAEQDTNLDAVRVSAVIFAGTQTAAENAAAAYMSAVQDLSGCPRPCGDTGVQVLAAANQTGPWQIPPPPDRVDLYSFQCDSDFILLRDP